MEAENITVIVFIAFFIVVSIYGIYKSEQFKKQQSRKNK
ncbi:Uncharacterised protein [Clostridium fallax]|uniref:Uncharacterized protein n=1 Tax=Clostridium fallax TaxID=1533 RepID=A0A1M4TVD2_9CLOT|nr:hypothetical protein SAMN05443638_103143 [Clostridium fallax]SQB22373.1 Uncharacterised protein [Clostridium fallax]